MDAEQLVSLNWRLDNPFELLLCLVLGLAIGVVVDRTWPR